ncbi:MAG: hypothetical protein A2Y94_06305 [Caldithrix sp. RBG_13_44_9]|nr:MAG: hypothetical protein A2Y94_06305 [Caldithrix sp. RBG_13_44_9]
MTRKNKIVILVLLFIFCLSLNIQAENLKKIAQTGMKWLSIPIGARGAALGGAYTAMSDDITSIFWNPAGIAYTEGGHVFLNQTKWIADINVNVGALTYQYKNWGVIGLSYAAADWGTLHGTQLANNAQGFEETGDFSPTNWALGFSYARKISDAFALGGNVKYLYEKLGAGNIGNFGTDPDEFTAKMNLFAFDVGTYYYTGFKDLRFAMSFQNFSAEKKYRTEQFPLPLTFKFGVAMDMFQFINEESNHHAMFAIDAIHPRDYSERLHFGLEYSFRNMVFLRGGYKTNYDEEDLSLGAGLHYGLGGLAFTLDYGYVMFKNFDAVQMFSFDFQF